MRRSVLTVLFVAGLTATACGVVSAIPTAYVCFNGSALECWQYFPVDGAFTSGDAAAVGLSCSSAGGSWAIGGSCQSSNALGVCTVANYSPAPGLPATTGAVIILYMPMTAIAGQAFCDSLNGTFRLA